MKFQAAKSILSVTSGFLGESYTHTLNPYFGCSFAGALCGTYCYARFSMQYTIKAKGEEWKLQHAKTDATQAYIKQYHTIKALTPRAIKKGKAAQPLRIYMSSITDPYVPQEKKLGITRSLLETMCEYPPDTLVLQTHNTLIERDFDLLTDLASKCELWVSLSIETDMEELKGFPKHASPVAKRLEVIQRFKDAGILAQVTISPLLPIENMHTFAEKLDRATTRVIIDHYLLGDGSKNGSRTKKTKFIDLLIDNGYDEWTELTKFHEFEQVLVNQLGRQRVLVSAEGFNAIGKINL